MLKQLYEWKDWEGIMHNVLCLLILYAIYLFATDKKCRSMTNILLFTIVISIDLLVHQNINIRNNKFTNYLL